MKVKEYIDQMIEEHGQKLSKEGQETARKFLWKHLKELDDPEMIKDAPTQERVSEMIETVIGKMDTSEYSEEQIEMNRALLSDIYVEGKAPFEAMGLNQNTLNAIYTHGYNMFQTGNIKQAIEIFQFLDFICPQDAKYSFGMASCYHILKDYDNAIKYYYLAGYKDRLGPVPFFHAADCFLQLELYDSAIAALAEVLHRAGDDPLFKHIVQRSKLLLETCKKNLKKEEE